jgi:4-hydroxy-3-methylbut-2-enyl diphosphate reductase
VIDATCPLAAKVRAEARRLDRRGDTVVLIGHADHEETVGTLGELGGRGLLVRSVHDVASLRVPDPDRISYLMQTTLSVQHAADIVAALGQRFPHIVGPGSQDICYATSNRQQALTKVAQQCDVVLVVGSQNSSNSRRLLEVAQRNAPRAYLVEDVHAVQPRWLAGAASIGISAGASAPPFLVDELVLALRGLGAGPPAEHTSTTETIRFTLPKEVAR